MRIESSEEEDDFPSIESVTPQSKIDTIYQSNTEKVCSPPPISLCKAKMSESFVNANWKFYLLVLKLRNFLKRNCLFCLVVLYYYSVLLVLCFFKPGSLSLGQDFRLLALACIHAIMLIILNCLCMCCLNAMHIFLCILKWTFLEGKSLVFIWHLGRKESLDTQLKWESDAPSNYGVKMSMMLMVEIRWPTVGILSYGFL